MTYKDNTPTYNVNRNVTNFKDFTKNIDCEEWKLKKLRRGFKPNSEEQQHVGNQKLKFNKTTRKWDEVNPDLVDDKIDAINKMEESKKEKKYEFLDEHPKYEELKKRIKELNDLSKEIGKSLIGGRDYVQEYITDEVN